MHAKTMAPSSVPKIGTIKVPNILPAMPKISVVKKVSPDAPNFFVPHEAAKNSTISPPIDSKIINIKVINQIQNLSKFVIKPLNKKASVIRKVPPKLSIENKIPAIHSKMINIFKAIIIASS